MKAKLMTALAVMFLTTSLNVNTAMAGNIRVNSDGSVTYGSHTYRLYNIEASWDEAESWCESMNGHLATITSSREQRAIETLLDNNELEYEGYWVGGLLGGEAGGWTWITGEKFRIERWSPGQPDGSGCYMQLFTDGTWDDTGDVTNMGIRSHGFICELDKKTVSTKNNGKVWRGGHIYELVNSNYDYETAYNMAKLAGGHLVTINSEEEERHIEDLIRSQGTMPAYWLGGGFLRRENSFVWLDTGEDFSYSKFCPGEPNGSGVVLQIMRYSDGLGWDDTTPDSSGAGIREHGMIIEYED